MESEKRQRVSVPQMVVSGEEEARLKVKVEAGGSVGRMVDSSQADDRKLIRLVRERRLLYARNNMPVASYYTQVKNLWDDVAAMMGWSVADVRRKWSHIRNSYSRHLRNEMHGACTSKGRMVSRWYLADELEFLREHMATDINTGRVKTSTQRSRECRARQKLLKVCDKKSVKRAKTTAERCKEYRQRQKMLKAAGIQRSPNENAKSPAQRAREYRARLKKKEEEAIALYFQQRRSNPYTSYAPTLLEMDLNESSSSEPVDVKPFIPNPWFALNPTPQSPALDHKPPSIQNEDSSSSTAFAPDENTSFFQFFRGIHSEFLELSARKQRRFKRKCLDFLHELLDDEDTDNQTTSYSHQDNVLNLSNSGHISEEEKDVKPVLEDGYILPNN